MGSLILHLLLRAMDHMYKNMILIWNRAVIAVIAWQLDLQLPMQSAPITTDVVGSRLRARRTTLCDKVCQ